MELTGLDVPPQTQVHLSEVIAALSYALDLTEGQSQGHAARSCLLGMRLARELRLNAEQSSALFYGLLMKDVGCSSNSSQLCATMGADDIASKKAFKDVDWTRFLPTTLYALRSLTPGAGWRTKLGKLIPIALKGYKSNTREMISIRCERGASIARHLQLPEITTHAILGLDEHWDGSGHPLGLRGEDIPLLSRVLSLAQTFDVFAHDHGVAAAYDMAKKRSGRWFDPSLVRILKSFRKDLTFWETFMAEDPKRAVLALEQADQTVIADPATLDRIAVGFSQVIDAKSPWTFKHSEGVATAAVGIAKVMGFSFDDQRLIRRAGLLHDIGKLGVSNLILDKPGRLNDEEIAEMRKHPGYTYQLLSQVAGFADIAELAAAHHEKLDGSGYHRGLKAAQLSRPQRILCVADIYDALAAERPYRKGLSPDEIVNILGKGAGTHICPEVFDAVQVWMGLTPTRSTTLPMAA